MGGDSVGKFAAERTLLRDFRGATGSRGVVIETRAGGFLPAVGAALDRLLADKCHPGEVCFLPAVLQ